ncbi:MAG: hypothetical protein U0269_04135 [Polyangiales bacterium]
MRRALFAWSAVVLCASDVEAFTLRVLAPTELRVAPAVRADRSAVTFAVQLRDDQGNPLVGAVRIDVRRARASVQRTVTTNTQGQASGEVPVNREDRVLEVRAQFAGDATHTAASSDFRVDLDAPFVTVVLQSAPSAVDVESRSGAELVASVEVGQLAVASPLGWPVQFYVDNDRIGTARSDATGRAALRVDSEVFRTPGVHVVRAAAQLRGTELWSNERRVIVRALTSVVANVERNERTGQLRVRGAVAWRGGGVAGATVRIEANRALVAAALTDGAGSYEFALPPRSLLAGVKARVVFVPTTPWLSGSESGEFYLAPPAMPAVSWRFALVPLALGLAAFALARLRSKPAEQNGAQALEEGASIEVRASQDGASTLEVVVEDRATGEPVEHCEISIGGSVARAREPVAVDVGTKVTVTLRAHGYEPREVVVPVRRAGALRLTVALARWREAIYSVAREFIVTPSGPKAAPTLREAGEDAARAVQPVLAAAESASYGPDEPEQAAFDHVRALADATRQREH